MTLRYYAESALLADGWAQGVQLSVESGRITAVIADTAPVAGDHRVGILLPGMPNLHSHGFQRGMAGLVEVNKSRSDSFWSWRELMYRFVERMRPEDLEAITAQAFAEMLQSGFTRVGEFHYVHHDADGQQYANPAELSARVAAAAERTGIGLTLLPVFYAHSGFGGQAPTGAQARFINDLDSFARLYEALPAQLSALDGGVLGVAPHSLRAVTPAQLQRLVALTESGPVHIHVAEQMAEVEQCQAWSGRRPVEWLLEHQPPDERWCYVHATHLTTAECEGLARSGAVAGLCPITEANLGDGVFPVEEFLAHGGRIGVGSDSNVRIDLAGELELLEYGQRLTRQRRNVLAKEGGSTGRQLLEASLIGGGQALGTGAGLRVGAPADFFSLRAEHPALLERRGDAIVDSWIFGSGRGAIDCVWRAGQLCVSEGRHVLADEIGQAYQRALQWILGG
ncbi:formimidoylglutamate deiminase [Parahaliea maris]|uniref:Formimidoylglutamate deiminase n=1 Tax=Parahaliea maris TaxID=2716870 RepID=A0A5C8ZX39_9GAMM|nr:formimidoylglutamate deiminase [Parahaliea maris]TXS93018.1 formimidoylglutamate deiminase [Parahaliea maris]